jgi:hypothetical protein
MFCFPTIMVIRCILVFTNRTNSSCLHCGTKVVSCSKVQLFILWKQFYISVDKINPIKGVCNQKKHLHTIIQELHSNQMQGTRAHFCDGMVFVSR